jgi:hypothetical protein
MRPVSDSEDRARGTRRRRPSALRPGEALITGGFSPRGTHPYAASRRRSTARVVAPLAVPVALGVTLGVILAVSAGPTQEHVNQGTAGTSSASTPTPAPPSVTHPVRVTTAPASAGG